MIEQSYEAEGADEYEAEGVEGEAAVSDGAPATEPEAATPRSIEDIAANMGWTPRESWRGDPDKWKPADQFVEHTAQVNSRLVTKLKTVEETVANINRVNQAIMERTIAEERQKWLAERQEAFDVGDAQRFEAADKKLGELQAPAPVIPPEVRGFVEKHASWWEKDQEATAWAVNRAGELARQGLSPARQVTIVERELGQYFPEYAPAQERPRAKAVALSQPGARAATSRGKTFADMPKEAQEAAAYFEKKGVSREDYVREYFAGQG